ncbi:MAG: tyrosine-type recombinase/integrase, partial [Deltaproteobacteria bacterium]|nr:tyrosine-type recombinase/integrase [Deltaproteobacteria bacterium]
TVEIELGKKAVQIIEEQKKKGPFVFCKKNGDPWKTNLHKLMVSAASNAGVTLPKRKAWHILRRTWASLMLQNGCDIETLRVLGNWKDFSMPMWYAEAGDSDKKRKALNAIPDLDRIENGTVMEQPGKVVNLNPREGL